MMLVDSGKLLRLILLHVIGFAVCSSDLPIS